MTINSNHDGLCNCCNYHLTDDSLTEGVTGFYCSEECLEDSESDWENSYSES